MRETFNQAFPHPGGVKRRSTGSQNDSIDIPQFPGRHIESAELGRAFFDGKAAAHGISNGVRLVKDLFQHEMGEGSPVDVLGRKLDLADLERCVSPCQREDVELVSLDRNHIVVVEVNNVPSVGHDRAHVAHDKVLTFANPQDKRAPAPGPQQDVRYVDVQERESVGSDDLFEGKSECVQQVFLIARAG